MERAHVNFCLGIILGYPCKNVYLFDIMSDSNNVYVLTHHDIQ